MTYALSIIAADDDTIAADNTFVKIAGSSLGVARRAAVGFTRLTAVDLSTELELHNKKGTCE